MLANTGRTLRAEPPVGTAFAFRALLFSRTRRVATPFALTLALALFAVLTLSVALSVTASFATLTATAILSVTRARIALA